MFSGRLRVAEKIATSTKKKYHQLFHRTLASASVNDLYTSFSDADQKYMHQHGYLKQKVDPKLKNNSQTKVSNKVVITEREKVHQLLLRLDETFRHPGKEIKGSLYGNLC